MFSSSDCSTLTSSCMRSLSGLVAMRSRARSASLFDRASLSLLVRHGMAVAGMARRLISAVDLAMFSSRSWIAARSPPFERGSRDGDLGLLDALELDELELSAAALDDLGIRELWPGFSELVFMSDGTRTR